MCYVNLACAGTPSQACTIGGANTAIDSSFSCGDTDATMDESAKFLSVFGPS
jgi:hypothetical protein